MASPTFGFRIVLLGDTDAGKSCLLLRYDQDTYVESFIKEQGIDYRDRTIQVDGRPVGLQIWDTASSSRNVTPSYYRGAHGVMIVYDVTNKKSFENVKQWMQDLYRYAPEDVELVLIGNKCDESSRAVDYPVAKEFADSLGIPLIETSAKTAVNVDLAFMLLVQRLVVKRYERLLHSLTHSLTHSLALTLTHSHSLKHGWLAAYNQSRI